MERSSPNPLSARRGQWAVFVSMAAVFAFLVRIVLAMWYTNSFDTEWYLMWAADMQNGFWNCYDGHVRQLDYRRCTCFCCGRSARCSGRTGLQAICRRGCCSSSSGRCWATR